MDDGPNRFEPLVCLVSGGGWGAAFGATGVTLVLDRASAGGRVWPDTRRPMGEGSSDLLISDHGMSGERLSSSAEGELAEDGDSLPSFRLSAEENDHFLFMGLGRSSGSDGEVAGLSPGPS